MKVWKGGILTKDFGCDTIGSGKGSGARIKFLKRKKHEASQKCEMEKEKSTSYVIFDFMVDDLGLRGVALKVYALIYSFTKAGGSCYGSIDYICGRTNAGRTAVKESLKRLMDKGYIFKIEDKSIRTNKFCANMALTVEKRPQATDGDPVEKRPQVTDDDPVEKRPLPGRKTTPTRSENDPNNKDNNKEITTTTTNIHSFKGEGSLRDPFLSADADEADRTADFESNFCADEADRTADLAKALDADGGYISMASIKPDPPPMRFFGQRRVVMMTLHQYVCLLQRLGIHTTLHYIRNLERCITSRPDAHYKNHYRTILRWAKEDSQAE